MEKSSWYEGDSTIKPRWRGCLPQEWKGSRPIQLKLPGTKFTSLLQVQSSKDGRLIKELAKIEPRLAKSSGYHVKLVERGGKPLSKVFSKDFGDGRCNRVNCEPCKNSGKKGPTLCMVKGVVYESTCDLCEKSHLADKSIPHKGRYVGQTARTLYERAIEHTNALENFQSDSFMFKHWANSHTDLLVA